MTAVMKLPFVAVLLIALAIVIGGLWFVFFYQEEMHAGAWTSLRIAVFDTTPGDEESEGVDGHHAPLVYRAAFAVPLRAYLAASLLTAIFLPPFASVAVGSGRISVRAWRILTIASWGLLLANSAAWPVSGERFASLGFVAAALGFLPSIVLAIVTTFASDALQP